MDLAPYIERIILAHPEFSSEEIEELCMERLGQLGSKTKESNKLPILLKYLQGVFGIDFGSDSPSKISRFASIPKRLLQSSADKKNQACVQIMGLSKQLGTTILFQDASYTIIQGSKIALVGNNGAGKSTLLKLILGKEEPDAGEIRISKNTKIGFLSQDIFRENNNRSVAEEMLQTLPEITAAMHQWMALGERIAHNDPDSIHLSEQQAELGERLMHHDGFVLYDLQISILGAFGISAEQLERPLTTLSGGEQTKVQIAKFVLQQVDLLILDEPTNHLDIDGIVFLEQFCLARGKTLVCISHDRRFLNTVFDAIVEIADHQLHRYKGNYDAYRTQKAALYEQQLKTFATEQKYLAQQETFINRFRYKESKAAQVQSRIKLLSKREKIDEPENMHTAKRVQLKRHDKRLPATILTIRDAVVGYDVPLVTLPPKLEVTKDMQIGIIGKNGVGKTTLVSSLLGAMPLLQGSCTMYPHLIIGSYAQIVDAMNSTSTIQDELVGPGVSLKEVMGILGSLSISAEKTLQPISSLSGGEKAKVALAKMILGKPDVIIMDEPTNHLDILSKESITAMLQQFTGVSIIISHDRDFLSAVSNTLRVINDRQLTVYQDLEKGFAVL